jgi:hypothetical protein
MIDGKIHVGPRKTEDRRWLIKEIIIINGLKIMARNGLRLLMLQERMLNDKKKKKKTGFGYASNNKPFLIGNDFMACCHKCVFFTI